MKTALVKTFKSSNKISCIVSAETKFYLPLSQCLETKLCE